MLLQCFKFSKCFLAIAIKIKLLVNTILGLQLQLIFISLAHGTVLAQEYLTKSIYCQLFKQANYSGHIVVKVVLNENTVPGSEEDSEMLSEFFGHFWL